MRLSEIECVLDLKLQKMQSEPWDNCGLLIGKRNKDITSALIALELTEQVLEEAKNKNCQLILTHHPAIFTGIKHIVADENENLILEAANNKIAVYSAHTNFDAIKGGLNDYLASLLGAGETSLVSVEGEAPILRLFVIKGTSAEDFILNLKKVLGIKILRMIGFQEKEIKKVALVTGAGADYAKLAFENEADIFITGDLKYHEAMEFQQKGYFVIDAGHFETEYLFPKAMRSFIKDNMEELSDINWVLSEAQNNPFVYHVDSSKIEKTPQLEGTNSSPEEMPKNSSQKSECQSLKIYTDGGSRGNPGPAAIGYVIENNGNNIYQYAENIGIQTNNVAEYQAVLSAISKAKELGAKELDIYLDSQLVERQLNGIYKVKNEDLKKIYDKIIRELKNFRLFKITHVNREQNTLADKLVNMALDQQKTIEIEEI